jgi:hypothetical protein
MVGYSYKIMADTLAESIIASDANTYINHIQCMGIYGYIVKWTQTNEEKLVKIKELRKKISSVVLQNPRDRDLDAAKHLIDRAYLRLGAGLDMIDD